MWQDGESARGWKVLGQSARAKVALGVAVKVGWWLWGSAKALVAAGDGGTVVVCGLNWNLNLGWL